MSTESLIAVFVAAIAGWAVPAFFRKTVGTRYISQRECDECNLRHSVEEIKTLVIELAIKAGVPAHEISKLAKRQIP